VSFSALLQSKAARLLVQQITPDFVAFIATQAAQAHYARSFPFLIYANVQHVKRDIFTSDYYMVDVGGKYITFHSSSG